MKFLRVLAFALVSACATPAVLVADLIDADTGASLGTIRFDGDAYAVATSPSLEVRARVVSKGSWAPLYPELVANGGEGIFGSVRRKTATTLIGSPESGVPGSVPPYCLALFGPMATELALFGFIPTP